MNVKKFKRIEADEQGIFIGIRKVKTQMTLSYYDSEPYNYNFEQVVQSYYEYSKVYLVAISNYCIRKVFRKMLRRND